MAHEKLLLSNRITRIYLDALSEIMGHHGLRALLRVSGLQSWVYNPPAYNAALEVDAADFALINTTLEEIYSPRGGRTWALRAGRVAFSGLLEHKGIELGVSDTAFRLLPTPQRVEVLLESLAQGLSEEQSLLDATVTKETDRFLLSLTPCPACWGRAGVPRPVCQGIVGLLQAALGWSRISENFWVDEIECGATKTAKDATCVFAINKTK
ncbi:MAG: hypothetical protein JW981_10345 [Anaerolineae bacterium]|nr:hypothetical protein [Anaerolineae bacterium]